MKRLKLNLRIVSLAISILLFTSLKSFAAVQDTIVAIVNDEVITLKDLKEYMKSTYAELIASGIPQDQLKRMMVEMEINGINRLIEDKLVLSRANEMGVEIKEDMVNKRMNEIKSNYKSEEDFLASLESVGANVTDVRKKVADQFKINIVISQEVKSKIFVNPQEVTKYYEENINQFKKKSRSNFDSIFINNGISKITARNKAEEVLKLIQQGEDFKKMIEQYSDSPSIGSVEEGQLLPEVEKIIFALKQDEVSPIIEVENGFFIFKMTAKIPQQTSPLKEVKDLITSKLYQEKYRKKLMAWLEELKKNAYIEIKE